MTAIEFETLELVDTWLWTRLSGDATLSGLVGGRVIGTLSGSPVPLPYVTYSLQGTRDIRTHDGTVIGTDSTYLVKAVNSGASWEVVKTIAKRVSVLLGGDGAVNVSVTGGSLTCVRERIIQEPEDRNGVQYRHLGGLYRIRASAHD